MLISTGTASEFLHNPAGHLIDLKDCLKIVSFAHFATFLTMFTFSIIVDYSIVKSEF